MAGVRPGCEPQRSVRRFPVCAVRCDVGCSGLGRRWRTPGGRVMMGHDGHRGWLYYLAADPNLRLRGIGRALIRAAEAWLRERGVRKAQLLVRRSNADVVSFYERIGFEHSTVIVMQRWIDKD
ncbi:GNAT family N-acetyltransferase [Lichenicoccus sp.]|uniref:GNAT family N-acetyltransferase n=1 Tax=Lichenicoccus sp. TaxID=2781899 RepID=UPI003D0B2709